MSQHGTHRDLCFPFNNGKNSLLFDIYKREETEIKLGLYCARCHTCMVSYQHEYVFVEHCGFWQIFDCVIDSGGGMKSTKTGVPEVG